MWILLSFFFFLFAAASSEVNVRYLWMGKTTKWRTIFNNESTKEKPALLFLRLFYFPMMLRIHPLHILCFVLCHRFASHLKTAHLLCSLFILLWCQPKLWLVASCQLWSVFPKSALVQTIFCIISPQWDETINRLQIWQHYHISALLWEFVSCLNSVQRETCLHCLHLCRDA